MTKPLFLFCLAMGLAHSADKWQMQYFYDQDKSTLAILDLKFPSSRRGIAAGVIAEDPGGRQKPVVLVTNDGGAKWDLLPSKETGVSLHFISDSIGWMAAEGGIWKTEESGRTWKRQKSVRGLRRVFFLDERRGWAVGAPKAVWQTTDGGQTWSKLKAAEEPEANPAYTAYNTIGFGGSWGLIAGSSRPPRRGDRSRLPDWVDPETAAGRREWPSLTILLETRDGGAMWSSSTTSMFGRILKISFWRASSGTEAKLSANSLALIEYTNSFQVPSEVMRIDLRDGKSVSVYRDKEMVVSDVEMTGADEAVIAGYEPPGSLRNVPIPGRVKFLMTKGLKEWVPMEMDYRAVARRVVLARSPEGGLWAATDTGMILKLQTQLR